VFAAALVAVVIPVSRYAYTWFRDISAYKHISYGRLEHPESSTDPQVLLSEANRLYWLNNGPRAGPLYAKAESLFANRGDTRNELYAKIGRLRSEAETMSFVELSRFLNDQLQNPIMRNDPKLRVWCLAAKGYTYIEIGTHREARGCTSAICMVTAVTRPTTSASSGYRTCRACTRERGEGISVNSLPIRSHQLHT